MSEHPPSEIAETDSAAPSLSGRWIKDKSQSDPVDKACELVELPWICRKAVAFLNTLLVEDCDDHFLTIVKGGSIFDVTECYPWGPGKSCGPMVAHKRRDKRSGLKTGQVDHAKGHPHIMFSWDAPLPGRGSERFVLSPDGQMLTHFSEIHLTIGGSCAVRTVYRRAPG